MSSELVLEIPRRIVIDLAPRLNLWESLVLSYLLVGIYVGALAVWYDRYYEGLEAMAYGIIECLAWPVVVRLGIRDAEEHYQECGGEE